MSSRIIALLVLLAVVASAVGVIYVKHQNRKLFIELEQQRKEQDQLDVDWGRLQLEQSTWATHGRIENIARRKLGMGLPSENEVVIVRP